MLKTFRKSFNRKFNKKKSLNYRSINNSFAYLLPADDITIIQENDSAPEILDHQKTDYENKPNNQDSLDNNQPPFSQFQKPEDKKQTTEMEFFEHYFTLPPNIRERFIHLLSQVDYNKMMTASSTIFNECLKLRGIEVEELTIESSYQIEFLPIIIDKCKLALFRSTKFIHSQWFSDIRVMDSLKLTIDDQIQPNELLQLSENISKTYKNVYLKFISSKHDLSFLLKLFHENVERVEVNIDSKLESWDDLFLAVNNVSNIKIYNWSSENLDEFKLLKAKIKAWISLRTNPLESLEFSFLPKNITDLNKTKTLYFCNGTYR